MSDPGLPWLFAGFAVVWLALGLYLLRLARAQRDVADRLDRLEHAADHRDPQD